MTTDSSTINEEFMAMERLEATQKLLSEEMEKQSRLDDTLVAIKQLQDKQDLLSEKVEKQKKTLREQADWNHSSSRRVGTFQKVGLEFVDQDKLERMRRGREIAQAMREKARRDIQAWREEFSASLKGLNPSINAAGPELVMTTN